jgi:cytochrome c biogenesis protein CcmG, thiol:disulfide interchange protein DsbE
MKLSRVQWNLLIVVILVAGAAWTAASRVTTAQATRERARRATPDIFLPTLDGGMFRLSQQYGKPVIVNFWATWCPPCRAELPAFEEVYKNHRSDGLMIVGVDIAEPQDVVTQFVADMGLTFPIALDSDGEALALYRVQGFPTTLFVGRDGTIRDMTIGGPLTKAAIEGKVIDLMK